MISGSAHNTQIARAARILTTLAPQLPTLASMETELADAERALERTYFQPDEDQRLRATFSRYLRVRSALQTTLNELGPSVTRNGSIESDLQSQWFAIGFCAGCMLFRSARFLIDSFAKHRVIWKKLDEPDPNLGIPRRQFTKIYHSVTSPKNVAKFRAALHQFEAHRESIYELSTHPSMGSVIELLKQEEPFIESSRRYYAASRIKYRWHSFLRWNYASYRKVTFSLFKVSGSLIAEMRLKWKRKRVTPAVTQQLAELIQPGDIIITRHDDATSNLFLPGFWPHAAVYIGSDQERHALDVVMSDSRWQASTGSIRVLEARKDGVLFRSLEDTLSVDCFVVLRSRLSDQQIAKAISLAIEHEGKCYDFEFDFRRADRLACTEVVYRAFHKLGKIVFTPTQRAGRLCLSAEDILDGVFTETPTFDVVAIFGCQENQFVSGKQAKPVLEKSYR